MHPEAEAWFATAQALIERDEAERGGHTAERAEVAMAQAAAIPRSRPTTLCLRSSAKTSASGGSTRPSATPAR